MAPQKRSFGYATLRQTMTPGKQAVLDAVNSLEEVRDKPSLLEERKVALRLRMSEYESSKADGVEDWEWHVPIMLGMGHGALGNFPEAIRLVQSSLDAAGISAQQTAISYNNLSDHYRRSGQIDDAVRAGQQAFDLWPTHGGIVCNFAMALARSGKIETAAQIVDELVQNVDPSNRRSVIAAHIRNEVELQEFLQMIGG